MKGAKMKREDFWYNPEAESAGVIPTGAKAGQFLFLSAQTSVDMDTGKIIRDIADMLPELRKVDICPEVNAYFGPIMAQTWVIYQNLSKILATQGACLNDIIRQRIYVPHLRDIRWMEKVMLSFFPEEKPATLILGVPNRGLHEDIRVWVDAIALMPQAGGLQKETIYLPALEKVTAPYPQAVRVGQFLFFEGYTGVDLRSGHPVTTLEELGTEAENVWVEGRFYNATSQATRCQYWLIFNHLGQLMESQGANLDDLFTVEGFSRHGMRDICDRLYLREKIFKTPQNAPHSSHLGNYSLSPIPDVEIIWGGIALLPGEYQKEPTSYSRDKPVGLYSRLIKAGPIAYAGGSGFRATEQKGFIAFSDLADKGRFLAQSRIGNNHPIMTRAWHIYSNSLAKAGVEASQVIHQTIYLKNPSEWPAVESIARVIFDGRIPPTTIVPVDEFPFYWQYHPESKVEDMIEMQLRLKID